MDSHLLLTLIAINVNWHRKMHKMTLQETLPLSSNRWQHQSMADTNRCCHLLNGTSDQCCHLEIDTHTITSLSKSLTAAHLARINSCFCVIAPASSCIQHVDLPLSRSICRHMALLLAIPSCISTHVVANQTDIYNATRRVPGDSPTSTTATTLLTVTLHY